MDSNCEICWRGQLWSSQGGFAENWETEIMSVAEITSDKPPKAMIFVPLTSMGERGPSWLKSLRQKSV
jgi:hypothetical protein